MNEATAKRIVKKILEDLTDRRGLSGAWDSIDADIQREIVKQWVEIILKESNKRLTGD